MNSALAHGAQGMSGRLRRVLVNRPGAVFGAAHETPGAHYPEPIDLPRAQAQHDALVGLLEEAGARVELLGRESGPDSIYTYDCGVVTAGGAVVLRSGKDVRLAEAEPVGAWYRANGVPVLGAIEAPGSVDGGDLLWLDDRTLVIGIGLRTNREGAEQLAALVEPFVDSASTVDLPYFRGPTFCLHLLSSISMLDRDLAVVNSPLMAVSLRRLLDERGVELVESPDEEFDTLGPNVLALAPREGIALDANPVTIERLRAAGVTVHALAGSDVAVKGGGGPTCLTQPLLRDAP